MVILVKSGPCPKRQFLCRHDTVLYSTIHILENLPIETEKSVVAGLTKLTIQRIESIPTKCNSTGNFLVFVLDKVLALLPEGARRCNDSTCPFGEYETAGCILLSGDIEHSTHISCEKI